MECNVKAEFVRDGQQGRGHIGIGVTGKERICKNEQQRSKFFSYKEGEKREGEKEKEKKRRKER